MANKTNSFLKLLSEPLSHAGQPDLAEFAPLGELCQAFTEATGWPLRYVPGPMPAEPFDLMWSAPVDPGVGTPPGHLRIDLGGPNLGSGATSDLDAAEALAASVAELLGELARTRHALWQREAELATSVPVVEHPQEEEHLASRIQSSLQSGVRGIHCDAAALYVLDDATQNLKLRASYGLPVERLTQPPRPLRGAVADLEALLGHAVVLEHADQFEYWRAPEDFGSAVCVPVSSPTMPLGTLWMFDREERAYSDEQTNVVELVAGRIASELEREVLMAYSVETIPLARELDAAQESQQLSFPTIAPPIEGWQIQGQTQQAQNDRLGGAFHDWFLLPGGSLAVMVGQAIGSNGLPQSGVAGGMVAGAVRAALRSHALHLPEPTHVLAAVNETLWTTSSGDRFASLWYVVIDPRTGQTRFASAGELVGMLVNGDQVTSLATKSLPLGYDSDFRPTPNRRLILPGERLLLGTATAGDSLEALLRNPRLPSAGHAVDQALLSILRQASR